MQLIGMLDSPYVRRCAVSLQLLGLPFEHRPVSVFRAYDEFRAINPVVKAPTLICDDGTVLMDSGLILDYAESLAEPARSLMPERPAERPRTLRLIGLALAACEKTVQIIYERMLRPAEKQHEPWIERVTAQLTAAYRELEIELDRGPATVEAGRIDQAAVTTAVGWQFTQDKLPGTLPADHFPRLRDLSAWAERLPPFLAAPSGESAMRANKIEIRTRDGLCPSYVFRPGGAGPWPAVLVFMDGLGIRPAMLEIGERLARSGYFVLLPDLFYRSGAYEPMDPQAVFSDPEKRSALMQKYFALATSTNIMSDTRCFLDFLAAQPEVKRGGIGTTGYCLGGRMSLIAAGIYPDRIAAAASYHGGKLASDEPDSPHLLAPKMKARVYIAGASDDQTFPEQMKQRLERALTDAGVDHRIETYPAKHGWVFRDFPVYDAGAAERHWQSMLALFEAKLGP